MKVRFSCLHIHYQYILWKKSKDILLKQVQPFLHKPKWLFPSDGMHFILPHLINRMLTTILNNLSLYQKLHHQSLNSQFLRVFGCACYPFLRLYKQYKLDFHSKEFLFLNYNTFHKVYKSLDKSSKVYIAIHISFNEYDFPYSKLFSSSPSSSKLISVCIALFCILNDSSFSHSFVASHVLTMFSTSYS